MDKVKIGDTVKRLGFNVYPQEGVRIYETPDTSYGVIAVDEYSRVTRLEEEGSQVLTLCDNEDIDAYKEVKTFLKLFNSSKQAVLDERSCLIIENISEDPKLFVFSMEKGYDCVFSNLNPDVNKELAKAYSEMIVALLSNFSGYISNIFISCNNGELHAYSRVGEDGRDICFMRCEATQYIEDFVVVSSGWY